MARSGLTKSQVRATRERLLAEGRYPSVDAVRHALGDSGSKSTIHRYLKELRDEAPDGGIRREDTGSALHALVDELADRLHADAEARIRTLRAEHAQALRAKDAELAALRQAIETLEARLAQQEALAQLGPPGAFGEIFSDGFGRFGGALLNSRACGRDSSPFSMIRSAARS